MKKLVKFWRIITIIVIIGLVLFACDDGKTPVTDPCANGHTPGAAATCETAQVCTVCNYVIKAATGHNWEWEEDIISATCSSASKDKASCLNENCTKTEERTGSHLALGHNLPGAYAATCMATGLTGIGHCNRCNTDLTGDVIPIDSENHDFGDWTQKTAATCIAPERLIRVCSYNAAHSEEENHGEVDPTAHDHNSSLICKNGTCGHQYEIGDTGPAGGIIFYIASSGFTVQGYSGGAGAFAEYTAYYLEAAPANEFASEWGASGTLIPDVTTFITYPPTAIELIIGNGRKDTQIIVNHLAITEETGRAAQVCASKNLNSFTDWFLPSLGELNEIYEAKIHFGILTGNFWSSSQYSNGSAWFQSLVSVVRTYDAKLSSKNVRAVRAF